jgi:hypothetical protein
MIINELRIEKMRKEAVVVYFKQNPGILLEDLTQTTENIRIVGVPIDIRTGHYQNISQKYFRVS